MLNFLQARLNQKNRAPVLVHSWDFWHDRQERSTDNTSGNYEDRLEPLAHINDVKQFWGVFNNFDINQLKLRDSVHLFHKGVKPVWEDPRNARGGSWTFRIPKQQASDFWREMCLLAIGEQLQEAVEDPARKTFRDDICGVSLSVRFTSMLVQVWNRDGSHEAGVERMLSTVMNGVQQELRPKEGSYYYKKHSEHAGFGGSPTEETQTTSTTAIAGQNTQSLDAVMRGS